MTHKETIEAELKELRARSEALNRESFDLKIKIKFNDKRIKTAEDELQEIAKNELLDVTKPD
jgi:hypothetical protein